MEIKFLGTGGAFDAAFLNSAALLNFNGMHVLLDCGFTVFSALLDKNLMPKVDYIILTHLHNDHCGSLANLLLYKSIIEKSEPPVILYPSETFRQQLYTFLEIQLKHPDQYAQFSPIQQFDGITCVDTYGQHSENYQSYAYIFDTPEERVVYSGDLARPEVLFYKLQRMSVKKTTVFHDITFSAENKSHTYYKKLLPYLNGIDLFGYHCDPTDNPPDNPIRLVFFQKEFLA